MTLEAAVRQHAHRHAFDGGNPLAERNTRRAMWLTAAMMLIEIIGGWWFNSMAVLADGWHMSSHVVALGLSGLAYTYARRQAEDRRFAFGTWKVEILGGYSSAILLLAVAALMAFHSFERLLAPQPIQHDQAIVIAVVGLAVNLICAWWLRDHHDDDDHGHHGHGGHTHQDLNLRAAYMHVIADAATSVLAIVALLGGKFWGADWLDPSMGIVGAVLVSLWAWGLLRNSSRVLLDAEMDAPVVAEIHQVIDDGAEPAGIADLHVWRVGRGHYAGAMTIVTTTDATADDFRKALSVHEELVHLTIEVIRVLPEHHDGQNRVPPKTFGNQ